MKLPLNNSFNEVIGKIYCCLAFVFVLILPPSISFGQEGQDHTFHFDGTAAIADQIPPLDILVQMAVAYHPTVKGNHELEGAAEQRVRLAKRSWSSLIRGYADYSTGNQSIITTGTQGNDISNFANGYRAGINLSIPFSEFYNRRDRIRLQQREMNAAAFRTQEVELTIASQVIEAYHNMVTGQILMKIQFEMQEKARANLQLTELEYKSGNMEGSVYIRNVEVFTIAQIDYENARKEFAIATQNLELLIGVPIRQIYQAQ